MVDADSCERHSLPFSPPDRSSAMPISLTAFSTLRRSAATSTWTDFERKLSTMQLRHWEEAIIRRGLLAALNSEQEEADYFVGMLDRCANSTERFIETSSAIIHGSDTEPESELELELQPDATTIGDVLDGYARAATPAFAEEETTDAKEEATDVMEEAADVMEEAAYVKEEAKEEATDIKEEAAGVKEEAKPPLTRSAARKRGREDEEQVKQEPKRAKRAESGKADRQGA